MNPQTIETPLSYTQLMTEVREGYTETKKSLIRLKSVKTPERVLLLGEFLRYPVFVSAAVIKLQAKGIQEAVEIAKAVSQKLSNIVVDKSQISQIINSQYGNLLSTVEKIKKDAETDLLKAKGMIRIVRTARKIIRKEMKKTVAVLESHAEAVEQQVKATKQQQEQPQYSKNMKKKKEGN
jgi:hypothetical protein|tara:strand:+ start:87 stop:626 length:540 start_codon:yes stop_codon:yes gene_type:complete